MLRSLLVISFLVLGHCSCAVSAADAGSGSRYVSNDTFRLSAAVTKTKANRAAKVRLRAPLTLISISESGPRKLRVRSISSVLKTRRVGNGNTVTVVSGTAMTRKGKAVGNIRLILNTKGSLVGAVALGVKQGDLATFYKVEPDSATELTRIISDTTPVQRSLEVPRAGPRAFTRDLNEYTVVRIATDLSCDMYGPRGHNFSSEAEANDFVVTAVSIAEAVYERQLNIIFDIVYQHAWTSCENDPYARALAGEDVLDVAKLASALETEWSVNFTPVIPRFDTAILFTTYLSSQINILNQSGEVVTGSLHSAAGTAQQSSSCLPRTYTISSAIYGATTMSGNANVYENIFSHAFVFAHEVGHTLGAGHDQVCPPRFIMCSSGTPSRIVAGFSGESIALIQSFISATRSADPACFGKRSLNSGSEPSFSRTSPVEARSLREGQTVRITFPAPVDPDGDITKLYISPAVPGAKIDGNQLVYTASMPFGNECSNRVVTLTLVAEDSVGHRAALDFSLYVIPPDPIQLAFNQSPYRANSDSSIPFSITKTISRFPLDHNGIKFEIDGTTSAGEVLNESGPNANLLPRLSFNQGSGDGIISTLNSKPGKYLILASANDCVRTSLGDSTFLYVTPPNGSPLAFLGGSLGTFVPGTVSLDELSNYVNQTVTVRRGDNFRQSLEAIGGLPDSQLRLEFVGTPPAGYTATNDGFQFDSTGIKFPQSCSSRTDLTPVVEVPFVFQAVDLGTQVRSNQISIRLKVYPGNVIPVPIDPATQNFVTSTSIPLKLDESKVLNLANYFREADGDPMTFTLGRNDGGGVSIKGNTIQLSGSRHRGKAFSVTAKDCNGGISPALLFTIGGSGEPTSPPSKKCKAPITSSVNISPKSAELIVTAGEMNGKRYSCSVQATVTVGKKSTSLPQFIIRNRKTKRVKIKLSKSRGKLNLVSTCALSCGTSVIRASLPVPKR